MSIRQKVLPCIAAAVISAGGLTTPAFGQSAPTIPSASFDWRGLYVGAYAAVVPIPNYFLGTRAGFNLVRGRFVASVEAEIGMITAGGAALAELAGRGRIGALARPRALVYYSSTLGYFPAAAQAFFGLGGGLEFALAPDVSVFAEAGYVQTIGFPPGVVMFQTGVFWRP